MPIPVPPSSEQAAIAKYLSHATRRIDAAIKAKRKIIALLEEQKRAIIQRAVTRGLDPKVKLKDSGVPWIGEIPEGWNLIPNRAYLKLRKELVGKKSKEYGLLSLTLRGIIFRDMNNPTGKWPASFDTYQVVESGDLVFCLFDIDETPRFVGLSTNSGMITGAYSVFQCNNYQLARWYYLFYLSLDYGKNLKPEYQGLRKTIPKSVFLGLKSPIPGEIERNAVFEYVEEKVGSIDKRIQQIEHEIALLREYRTRLVTDVVTGKLDVREVADGLSEYEENEEDSEDEVVEDDDEGDEDDVEGDDGLDVEA
jgi:type I restriction enzyme S subunit